MVGRFKLYPSRAKEAGIAVAPLEPVLPKGFRVAAIATGIVLGIITLLIDWYVGRLLG